MATVGILYALNDIARRRGGTRVMLAISEQSLPPAHQASIDAMLAPHSGPGLKKTLGWPHLMALGVGAIVGTGIYTLVGVGADDNPEIINYRADGDRFVVDQVLERAALISGVGRHQTKVEIVREGGR